MNVDTVAAVPIEDLSTIEREYKDGVLVERSLPTEAHSRLQTQFSSYLTRHRKQWNIRAYAGLTVKVRENWAPVPDVCVYIEPGFEGRYPSVPPLLWIEILSPGDSMTDVWDRAKELIRCGVPYVWFIDPESLESELHTASGFTQIKDKTLTIPETPIVIPLVDVMNE